MFDKRNLQFPTFSIGDKTYSCCAVKEYKLAMLYGEVYTKDMTIEVSEVTSRMDIHYLFVAEAGSDGNVKYRKYLVGTRFKHAEQAYNIFRKYECHLDDLAAILEENNIPDAVNFDKLAASKIRQIAAYKFNNLKTEIFDSRTPGMFKHSFINVQYGA